MSVVRITLLASGTIAVVVVAIVGVVLGIELLTADNHDSPGISTVVASP